MLLILHLNPFQVTTLFPIQVVQMDNLCRLQLITVMAWFMWEGYAMEKMSVQ